MLKRLRIWQKLISGTCNLKTKTPNIVQNRGLKICLLGARGTVGQPTSLLIKTSQWFEEAALYDECSCKGLAIELNHIDTPCLVTCYEGEEGLQQALKGSSIVVNMVRSTLRQTSDKRDVFYDNAPSMQILAKQCAIHCPQAFHVIVTQPINSMVPVVCEIFKKVNGCVDPARIFGCTSIDLLRAATFMAELTQTPPETVKVPVVGGHSENTIVPILSKTEPNVCLTTEEKVRITRSIQSAGQEAFKALEGKTAGLSTAYGIAKMAENLAKAIFGEKGIVEYSYVMSNLIPDIKYFSSGLILGPTGIQKILPLPELSNYEGCLLQTAVETLKKDIEKGEKYATA